MKRLVIVCLFLAVVLAPSVYSVDVGSFAIDIGIPILYVNNAPFSSASNNGEVWSTLAGNLRAGVEGDVLLNIVPGHLGVGFNTAILMGTELVRELDCDAVFMMDIPLRGTIRIGVGGPGYLQLHGGVLLKNVTNSASSTNPAGEHYIDVGARLRIGGIGFEGGYLVETNERNARVDTADEAAPFYLGLYIPII